MQWTMTTATLNTQPTLDTDSTPDVAVSSLTATTDVATTSPTAGLDVTTAGPDLMTGSFNMDVLFALMELGGPVVWLLGAMSVIALTLIIAKCLYLISVRPERTKDVDTSLLLWKQGDSAKAQQVLNTKKPISQLTQRAMQGVIASEDKHTLEAELSRLATNHIHQLRSYLKPLEIIANLSPLLGLLGTVLGMIVAFQQMADAGSKVDPALLSGGIWQALLTTAVGLIVAIPVLTAHSWLDRKMERIATRMNDAVTQVLTSAKPAGEQYAA